MESSGIPSKRPGFAELRGINGGGRGEVATEPTKQRGVPAGPLDSSRYRSGPVLNRGDVGGEWGSMTGHWYRESVVDLED